MLKKLLVVSCAIFLSVSYSYGAILTWGARDFNGFSEQNGTQLAIGQVVRVGTFNIGVGATQAQTDAFIQANADNVAVLNSAWTSMGFARIGDVVGTPSNFQSQSTADTTAYQGRQVYLWALRSTNASTEATAVSTATQIAIVYLPLTIDSEWAIPNHTGIPDIDNVIDLADLTDSAAHTSLVAGAKVLVGSFPDGTNNFGELNFGLAPVPEPSSVLLLCGAGLALSVRRFRSKS